MSFIRIVILPVVLSIEVLVGLSVAHAAELRGSRPNIVMILSDDMGYAQPGFTGGNPELTPNMDQPAADGVQLKQ